MSVPDENNPPKTLAFWAALLQESILIPDVDKNTVLALCHHLADLGVLKQEGEDDWKLTSYSGSSSSVTEEFKKQLQNLCRTEQGFALPYFLQDPPAPEKERQGRKPDFSQAGTSSGMTSRLPDGQTSDLSNLQIVKKYGRQMESFIELEKSYTEKLSGQNTSLKEARKIFNFILSRVQQKMEPRAWEQLSRRRHK